MGFSLAFCVHAKKAPEKRREHSFSSVKILPFLLKEPHNACGKTHVDKQELDLKLVRVHQNHCSTEIKYAVPEPITFIDFPPPVMKEKHK